MTKLLANSGDPDQMLCSAMSDLSLHCLPVTILSVSQLQWVKRDSKYFKILNKIFFLTENCAVFEQHFREAI